MEDKLRQRDAMIEKLRLKNATLKTAKQKVESQLRQKEEMGDVLHYIDFHQLQIENKQYVQKIEERNEELLKLKLTTGTTVQALNTLKIHLNSLLGESNWLAKEIKSRNDQLERLQTEAQSVQVRRAGKAADAGRKAAGAAAASKAADAASLLRSFTLVSNPCFSRRPSS